MSSVITGSTPTAPYSCYRLWVLLHPHPLHKVSRDNVQKMKITISFCKVTKVQTGPSKSFQSPSQSLKSSSPNVVFLRLATRLRAAGRLHEHAVIPGTGMVRIPPVILSFLSFPLSCLCHIVFAFVSFELSPWLSWHDKIRILGVYYQLQAFSAGGPENVQFGLAMDAVERVVKSCLS